MTRTAGLVMRSLLITSDKGHINDVDVSGLTMVGVVRIPGNTLQGNWKIAVFVDSKATAAQKEAILEMHTGKLGGPLADLAKPIGEVVEVADAPIHFDFQKGQGTIRVGDAVSAEMQPYSDARVGQPNWWTVYSAPFQALRPTWAKPRSTG